MSSCSSRIEVAIKSEYFLMKFAAHKARKWNIRAAISTVALSFLQISVSSAGALKELKLKQ